MTTSIEAGTNGIVNLLVLACVLPDSNRVTTTPAPPNNAKHPRIETTSSKNELHPALSFLPHIIRPHRQYNPLIPRSSPFLLYRASRFGTCWGFSSVPSTLASFTPLQPLFQLIYPWFFFVVSFLSNINTQKKDNQTNSNNPMAADCSAIFVHAGAGYHSLVNEPQHLKACAK